MPTPTPIETLVAEAVVADLNTAARNWSLVFVAEEKAVPVWDIDAGELKDLKCCVTATAIENERQTRGTGAGSLHEFRYRVVVDFQKEVNPADRNAVKVLQYLGQEVHDYYLITAPALTVTGLTQPEVTLAERPFTYDLDRLDAQGIFETWIVLTVTGYRP